MTGPRVEDGGNDHQMWRVAANILNKQSRRPTRGGPSAWVRGEGLTSPHRQRATCYEMLRRTSELTCSCEHGNEPSDSLEGGEFVGYLSDY
jgi:hypothetical protein